MDGSDGKSAGGNVRNENRERAAEISTFSSPASIVTAPGLEVTHRVGHEARGDDGLAVVDADHLDHRAHGEVEVGARHGELVALHEQVQSRGRADRAGRHRPRRGRERLDQDVAL